MRLSNAASAAAARFPRISPVLSSKAAIFAASRPVPATRIRVEIPASAASSRAILSAVPTPVAEALPRASPTAPETGSIPACRRMSHGRGQQPYPLIRVTALQGGGGHVQQYGESLGCFRCGPIPPARRKGAAQEPARGHAQEGYSQNQRQCARFHRSGAGKARPVTLATNGFGVTDIAFLIRSGSFFRPQTTVPPLRQGRP